MPTLSENPFEASQLHTDLNRDICNLLGLLAFLTVMIYTAPVTILLGAPGLNALNIIEPCCSEDRFLEWASKHLPPLSRPRHVAVVEESYLVRRVSATVYGRLSGFGPDTLHNHSPLGSQGSFIIFDVLGLILRSFASM